MTIFLLLLVAVQTQNLIRVDDEVALEHVANFAANRLPHDKFLSRAKISYIQELPELAFHDIDLITAISFKSNFARTEKLTDDADRLIQDVRRLRNKEVDCFHQRTARSGISSSNFTDMNKLSADERKRVRAPGFLDPYHMIVQTVSIGDPYNSDSHFPLAEEYQICNLNFVAGAFRDTSNGSIVVRSYFESVKVGTEIVFDSKQGFMPAEYLAVSGLARADFEAAKPLSKKVLLKNRKQIKWKNFKDNLWLPTKINGEYLQRSHSSQEVVVQNEFEIDVLDWWIGDEVPDEVFTFEDLALSELGKSKVQLLIKERESKK